MLRTAQQAKVLVLNYIQLNMSSIRCRIIDNTSSDFVVDKREVFVELEVELLVLPGEQQGLPPVSFAVGERPQCVQDHDDGDARDELHGNAPDEFGGDVQRDSEPQDRDGEVDDRRPPAVRCRCRHRSEPPGFQRPAQRAANS